MPQWIGSSLLNCFDEVSTTSTMTISMKRKQVTLKQRQEYIEFLEKRLASSNYKNNVSESEYKKTEEKLKKEKLLVKMLGK